MCAVLIKIGSFENDIKGRMRNFVAVPRQQASISNMKKRSSKEEQAEGAQGPQVQRTGDFTNNNISSSVLPRFYWLRDSFITVQHKWTLTLVMRLSSCVVEPHKTSGTSEHNGAPWMPRDEFLVYLYHVVSLLSLALSLHAVSEGFLLFRPGGQMKREKFQAS